MRIEGLDIEGFGELCDRKIDPFHGSLTVVHGLNEAGKTTILSFVRTILFGFPRQGRDQFYAPVNGGRHGGRITVQDDDGVQYEIERFAGVRGGSVRITTGNGEQFEDGLTLRRLLGNASRQMFETVFAFGLQELQNTKSLSQSDVSDHVYSAGMGASGVPTSLAALARQREEIFKPGGSLQPVAEVLNDLYQIDAKLDQAMKQAEDYSRLTGRSEQIEVDLESGAGAQARLSADKGRIERLRQSWEDWVRIGELEKQLKLLRALRNFPEDAIVRLDAAEGRLRQANEDLGDSQREVAKSQEAANAPIQHEPTLKDKERIEQILRRRGSFDSSVRDLPERKAELRALEDALKEALRELGEGWDEASLAAFDTSIQARDKVAQWRRRLDEEARVLGEAKIDAKRAEEAARYAAAATEEVGLAVEKAPRPDADSSELLQRRAALRAARNQLMKYGLAQQRHEDLQFQLEHLGIIPESKRGQPSGLWLILGSGGVVSATAGLAIGGSGAVLGLVIGAMIAILGAYLFATSRGGARPFPTAPSDALTRRLQEAIDDEKRESEALLELSVGRFADGVPDAEVLDGIEAELDRMQQMIESWTVAQKDLEKVQAEEKRQRNRADEVAQAAEKARESAEASKREWGQWLADRGLTETLVPSTTEVVFERVEAGRLQLKGISAMRMRISAIEKDTEEFRSLVEPLAAAHGVPLADKAHAALAVAGDELIRRLAEAREAVTRRTAAIQAVQDAQKRLDAREERVDKTNVEIDSLLRAGDAGDSEAFRQNARQQAERQALEGELRRCEERLRVLSGPGKEYERFVQKLSTVTLSELDEESSRTGTSVADVEGTLAGLREERGGIRKEIERLASDEETSELRARRAELIEKLRVYARDWSALTIAQTLLERARSRYEAERQPAVIRHAQAFFETVTGGRYKQLIAPLGTQTVTAIQRDGTTKTPGQLSRGTQEQLYLALRFGLIRQFGEQEVCLPVIVDEVLVNFDPERARHAAEAFADLARTNQVLVFTCHPETVDLFTKVDPEVQVIGIGMIGA